MILMFEQQDSDYDLVHERILRIEDDLKTIQNKLPNSNPSRPTPRSLFQNDSPDGVHETTTHRVKRESTTTYSTPEFSKTSGYNRGPSVKYLRKNVHITCTEQEQILEFYIKLRLAIEKGGIYILPIDQITKDSTISQHLVGTTPEEEQSQSNALYTLLSNENIIPNDFVMAQNCLLAYSSRMDGFAALKAMLKLTHPTLTNKRPPTVAPILSETQDIHSYEHSLKNFYLLHKLYNNTVYTPLEKSKQFIQGIDDDQYKEAILRIRNQLDTVQTLGIPLHSDYTIENITSTIINITSEYDTNKTVIRTMHQNDNYKKKSYSRKNNNHSEKQSPRYNQRPRKITKAQCHACKLYGHIVTHCNLLPKVLAIIDFSKQNQTKCKEILRQHIHNNTVDSKKTFVRTLQSLDVLPQDDNSDYYMEDDAIICTLIDNAIKPDEVISSEE